MATKYIIEGAAFDGDGTTSSVAASDGAAGAWNDFEAVLEGTQTYGSYGAGDVIYCATNDGTSDLGVTMSSSSITSQTFNDADTTVTLIFDDGTNVGSAGTFTITRTLSSYTFTNDGWVIKGNNRLVFYNSISSSTNAVKNNGEIYDSKVKFSGNWPAITPDNYIQSYWNNLTIEIPSSFASSNPIFAISNGSQVKIDGLTVDFTSNGMTATGALFPGEISRGGRFEANNVRIINDSSTAIQLITQNSPTDTNGTGCFLKIEGLDVGSHYTEADLMPLPYDASVNRFRSGEMSIVGGISYSDAAYAAHHGYVTWLGGKNYPTLNALLPDGVTNWSWRIFPRYAYPYNPVEAPIVRKFFEDTAATKTLTLELLVEDTVTNVDDFHVWMEVQYIKNSDSLTAIETTRADILGAATTLTTSTAGWSSTTYGALTYDKYKIAHTTANAIKKDTEILIKFYVGAQVTTDTKFWFFDPDVSIT